MKSILIVASYMNIGGVEKSLISLLNSFPRDNYKINLLLADKSGPLLKYIPKHIEVGYIPLNDRAKMFPKLGIKKMLIFHLKKRELKNTLFLIKAIIMTKVLKNDKLFVKYLFDNIPTKKYDIVINYCGATYLNSLFVEEKIIAPQKLIWLHNEFTKANISPLRYEKHYKKYTNIIGVSKNTIDDFLSYYPNFKHKTNLMYNIISKDILHNLSCENVEFDPSYKGLKILSIGRLSYQKGFDLSIKVLYRLLKNGYDVRWYILGEGEERQNLINNIKQLGLEKSFILLGADINPYKYIRQCDIYVQPSRFEGYAITLAEARLLYKPIITTNFAGADEQIIDGKSGLIVNFDENELYDALCLLINNTELRNQFTEYLINNSIDTTEQIDILLNIFEKNKEYKEEENE